MFALREDTPPLHLCIHRPCCAQGAFAALSSDNGYSCITGRRQASARTLSTSSSAHKIHYMCETEAQLENWV